MTTLILPWKRPDPMPLRRASMPTQSAGSPLRPGYRLVPVNEPSTPPHFHVELNVPEGFARPDEGMQTVLSSTARSVMRCADIGCLWFLNGKEGESDGAPFRHPAGVECGDATGCLDDNCPCPDNVVEWPHGEARGHIAPCQLCEGRFRFATSAGVRPVGFDEFFYRLDEGADTLVTILKRGL